MKCISLFPGPAVAGPLSQQTGAAPTRTFVVHAGAAPRAWKLPQNRLLWHSRPRLCGHCPIPPAEGGRATRSETVLLRFWKGGLRAQTQGGYPGRHHVARGPEKTEPRPAVAVPGRRVFLCFPEVHDSRWPFPGRLQAGILAPGSSFRCAFPSVRCSAPTVACATVVAGYSGASAADSNGLPFWSVDRQTPITRGILRPTGEFGNRKSAGSGVIRPSRRRPAM